MPLVTGTWICFQFHFKRCIYGKFHGGFVVIHCKGRAAGDKEECKKEHSKVY